MARRRGRAAPGARVTLALLAAAALPLAAPHADGAGSCNVVSACPSVATERAASASALRVLRSSTVAYGLRVALRC